MSILLAFLALCGAEITVAQETRNSAPQARYAPNEIIVQFAPSMAPHTLEAQIAHEEALKSTLTGQFQFYFLRGLRAVQGQPSPNDHQNNIETATIKVGAHDLSPMFDVKGESQENTYLIKLDGSVSVHNAVKTFEALEEVVYAQPNYIYKINYE